MDDNCKKELFGVRVYAIAEGYGITKTSVREIVNAFTDEARQVLLDGSILRIGELAVIRPKNITNTYIPTMGYLSKKVSDKTGLPYHTVYSVIDAYLDTVKNEILSGRSADIRKLISFHVIFTVDGKVKVNCALSASVRNDLRSYDVANGARVSFSKRMRSLLKEGTA